LNEVENKIKLQRQNIIEIATSSLSTVNQTLSDLDYRVAKISKEISSLPRQELNMGNIQRQFNINESIYTYLLQKRSEATITMASNYPDFALFEPARKVTSYQVTPKYLYSYIIALILGIGIPSGLMLLKNLINFKIINTEFIHQVIDRSPIATIYSISEKGDNIIFNDQASVSSESFRALRSIVFRKLSGITRSKVILITSAQPHDGKSFLSFNFATSIAMVGKKTLVIDADLKRPVLHNKFKLENKIGVSNFMAENNTIEEIINKTSVENLSFISAGPYMPNVTEVIESGGMDSLIAAVRDKFEYIIIDTSPIGFMADALLMTRYADHILLVVRNNSTLKDTFTEVIENFKSNNIANYDVVFNDKNMKDSHHGSYSNYYIKEKKSSLKDIIKQKID
jgi:capsular exopolysaccharide synthesis family protein